MNRDELKGRTERLRGKAKQAVGDLTDDEKLRDEGEVDEATGRVLAFILVWKGTKEPNR